MSAYTDFRDRWKACTGCELCESRRNVVLFRGAVPCSILFVGEAPGESEDVLGKPFSGPAGKMLDEACKAAGIDIDPAAGIAAWTNIVCCIPRDEAGDKVAQPSKESLDACRERLVECIELCNPASIVWVGELAKKWGPLALSPEPNGYRTYSILHPAAIMRMSIAQKGLAYQQVVARLTDVLEELPPF